MSLPREQAPVRGGQRQEMRTPGTALARPGEAGRSPGKPVPSLCPSPHPALQGSQCQAELTSPTRVMPARALLPILLLCVLLRQAEGGFRGQRRTQSRWCVRGQDGEEAAGRCPVPGGLGLEPLARPALTTALKTRLLPNYGPSPFPQAWEL